MGREANTQSEGAACTKLPWRKPVFYNLTEIVETSGAPSGKADPVGYAENPAVPGGDKPTYRPYSI